MYKLIFSDIDGTLLNSHHQISHGTKETVQKLKNRRLPFVLVSARMPEGIYSLQEELAINEPIICFSGALLLSEAKADKKREVLYEVTMKENDVREIYQIVSNRYPTICFTLYNKEDWFVSSVSEEWVIQEQEIIRITPKEYDFSHHLYPPVHKLLCMGEPEEIDQLESRLRDQYPFLSIYKSKPSYLEIMAADVTKAATIDRLAKQLKVNSKEIIAFGDNFNDMDMLQYAGLGVAMGNAPEIVKKAADVITKTNDEDGLVQVIEKYCLNSR